MSMPYLCSSSFFSCPTSDTMAVSLCFSLSKDVWWNGGLNPLNTAAVAGKHPRIIAYRPPGHPFVSGRRKRQWVPGSLCVKGLWNYRSNSLVLGNESGKWVRTYPGICFSWILEKQWCFSWDPVQLVPGWGQAELHLCPCVLQPLWLTSWARQMSQELPTLWRGSKRIPRGRKSWCSTLMFQRANTVWHSHLSPRG